MESFAADVRGVFEDVFVPHDKRGDPYATGFVCLRETRGPIVPFPERGMRVRILIVSPMRKTYHIIDIYGSEANSEGRRGMKIRSIEKGVPTMEGDHEHEHLHGHEHTHTHTHGHPHDTETHTHEHSHTHVHEHFHVHRHKHGHEGDTVAHYHDHAGDHGSHDHAHPGPDAEVHEHSH